jgi:hypothetical protein
VNTPEIATGIPEAVADAQAAERDDAIRALVKRLARPHGSGGKVIERAAIVAEGADSAAVIAWITAHAGIPETAIATPPRHGLHGARLGGSGEMTSRAPLRFVLPASALT